jgi:hypothetical protein
MQMLAVDLLVPQAYACFLRRRDRGHCFFRQSFHIHIYKPPP